MSNNTRPSVYLLPQHPNIPEASPTMHINGADNSPIHSSQPYTHAHHDAGERHRQTQDTASGTRRFRFPTTGRLMSSTVPDLCMMVELPSHPFSVSLVGFSPQLGALRPLSPLWGRFYFILFYFLFFSLFACGMDGNGRDVLRPRAQRAARQAVVYYSKMLSDGNLVCYFLGRPLPQYPA